MLYLLAIPLLLATGTPAFSLVPRDYARPHALLARQNSSIDPSELPAQCQSSCTTTINLFSSCTQPTCLCTNTNGEEVAACMDCLVSVKGSDPQGNAQGAINDFNQACAGTGITSISLSPNSTQIGTATGTATGVATGLATGTAIATNPTGTQATGSPLTATSSITATSTSIGTAGSGGSTGPSKSGAAIGKKSLGRVLEIGVASALVVLML